jgi:tetratricopeptide (TPR) repeat protein
MALGIILFGVVLIYSNMLGGAFVSDDYATVMNNPLVTNLWFNLRIIDMVSFINSLVAVFFGVQSPVPFHLFSLMVYLLVIVAAFVWLRIWFGKVTALISITLFAFLPIHVENVSWISGKPYLLVTLFSLLALITFSLYALSGRKKYLYLFLATTPLPFWVERARGFTLPLVLALFVLVFYKEFKARINWTKFFVWGLLASGVILVILWPMMMVRIGTVNSGYNASESVFYNPFFQYPTAVAKYLQLILFPIDLTLYHTMYIFPLWLNWSIFLTYLANLVWFGWKNKKIFFALAFVFVATLPSMAPVKVSWLVAERYVFFGSLGFCLAVVLSIGPLIEKHRNIGLGLLTVALSLFASKVFLRNIDWRTNHNLWVNTCQVSPNSHNAWNNIGDDYDKLKQYDNAIKGFTQSVLVKPNYADAYHNRANIFFKTERFDLARESYQTALNFNPAMYQTYLSLIQIDLMEKQADLAIQHANAATQLQPDVPQSWYVLGVVLAQVGKADLAKESMKKSLSLDPNYGPANEALIQLSTGGVSR